MHRMIHANGLCCRATALIQDDILEDRDIETLAGLVQDLPGGCHLFRQQSCDDDAMLMLTPLAWGQEDAAVTARRIDQGIAIGLMRDDRHEAVGLATTPWTALLLIRRAIDLHGTPPRYAA